MTSTLEQGHLCRRFWFVHESGDRLYPYAKLSKQSGRVAFAVAKPGAGNNLASQEIPVSEEAQLEQMVIEQQYSVRCRTQNRQRDGLYNVAGHSIVRLERAS